MKTLFSFILFLSLAVRPLYNIGYVAYFELNIDYIIETYCENKEQPKLHCNGQCHLAKKLALTSAEDTTKDVSLLEILHESFFPVYFHEVIIDDLFKTKEVFQLKNWNYLSVFSSFFKDVLDPPPKTI